MGKRVVSNCILVSSIIFEIDMTLKINPFRFYSKLKHNIHFWQGEESSQVRIASLYEVGVLARATRSAKFFSPVHGKLKQSIEPDLLSGQSFSLIASSLPPVPY